MPFDSDLMTEFLSTLPHRPHSRPSFAARGELEYYYVAAEKDREADLHTDQLLTERTAELTDATFDKFGDMHAQASAPAGSERPKLAIADRVVKADPEEIERRATMARYKDNHAAMKKQAKNMQDAAWEGCGVKAKLELLIKDKPYLKPLLETFEEQYSLFVPAKDRCISFLHTIPEDFDETIHKRMTELLADSKAHHDAFKASTLKEIQALLK